MAGDRAYSNDQFFKKRARELQNVLLERGYKNKLIKECTMKARKTTREEAFKTKLNAPTDRVPLVVTYNPALPNLHKILNDHLPNAELRLIYLFGYGFATFTMCGITCHKT